MEDQNKFLKAFQELYNILTRLLAPDGCPWDKVQTMHSIRANVIEEASELVEAIDSADNLHIKEELGDLFFVLLFLCKLAEKEKRCRLEEVLEGANSKLISRHPHIFGDAAKLDDSHQVLKQWNELKKKEKAHRTSVLEGIPKALPALARAQKVYKKLKSEKYKELPKIEKSTSENFIDEESLGKMLWTIVIQAQEKGLDAEHSLRKTLMQIETAFRAQEKEGK